MSDASAEIVKLQNRVAELEEDKGNLQLHLVDFDELKGKNKNFKTKYVFHPPAPLSCGCGAGMFGQVVKMLHYTSFTTDNPKQNLLAIWTLWYYNMCLWSVPDMEYISFHM